MNALEMSMDLICALEASMDLNALEMSIDFLDEETD